MSEGERRAGGGHTDRSIDAVHKLREAGVKFASRAAARPAGMQMLIEPLALDTRIAAFDGGLLVDPDMSVLAQKVIPEDLVAPIVAMLDVSGLDVWIYRGAEWPRGTACDDVQRAGRLRQRGRALHRRDL